jgi:hypothetical protein
MRPPVLLLALLVLVAAGAASAPQRSRADTTGTGGTGGSTTLSADDFTIEIWVPDPDDTTNTEFAPLNKIDQDFYFGRARCQCNTPIRVRVDMLSTSRAKVRERMNGTVAIGTGLGCDCMNSSSCVGSSCVDLGGERSLSALATSYVDFNTTVGALFAANSGNATDACERRIDARNIYVRPDLDHDGYPDVVKFEKLTLDGEPPPAPTGLRVSSGNEALDVSWTGLPLAEVDDLLGYSVFCARGGVVAPFADDFSKKKRHETRQNLCPTGAAASSGSSLITQALTAKPPEKTAAPDALRRLDPNFLCAGFLTSGQSARITGLENHIPYVVGVAAVDIRNNASVLENAVVAWPFPTRDFYTTYRADGGTAEGGFCTLGGHRAASGSGWWGLLLAAVAVALRRRRSRR